jgi:hypothetical protein
MFAQDRAPKVGLHIGTTSSECAVSIRLHLGATLANKAPTQLGPTRLQLGTNLVQNGATSPQVAPIWEQLPTWGHCRPSTKLSKNAFSLVLSPFFGIDEAARLAMFPVLCLGCAQLGAKLLPTIPSCAILDVTWTFMRIT